MKAVYDKRQHLRRKRLRILIYSRAFAPLVGGIETVVSSLAHGLVNAGAEVTLVTTTPAQSRATESSSFALVRRPGLLKLARLMMHADLIHLAGPSLVPLLVALLIRRPVFVEHHGLQVSCPNGQLFFEPKQSPCPGHFMAGRHSECWRCNAAHGRLRSLRLWLLTFVRRWLCRLAPANIAPTGWLASVLQLPNVTTIHHGISIAQPFIPPKHVHSPVAFVFLGRLVTTKGVTVLLDAALRLRISGVPFSIKIIGEGPERGNLEARVRALGLEERIVFLGALDEQQLEEVVREVDAVVMPSLGGEVFGLVAAEFMARGRALIVSDLGALSEVVGETGIRFPAGDSEALAQRLQAFIADPRQLARLGLEGRTRAADLFQMDMMIRKHLELYRHWIR
jgi:glycosyltransferase involved in cell wall biosynthesis